MKQFQLILLFISLCFGDISSFAQIDDSKKIRSLEEKINGNRDIALSDPELYYRNVEELFGEAIKLKDHRAELRLMGQRCWYFNRTMKLDEAIKAELELKKKAIEYKDIYHQALAYQYSSHTYALSGLPDKSISEYKQAISLLEKLNPDEQEVRYLKSNVYATVANAYLNKKEYDKAISALLKADKEIKRFNDTELKRKMSFLNYSSLGLVSYRKMKVDSAYHYAIKSMEMKSENEEISTSQFQNYLVLGFYHKERAEIEKAIVNFKNAEHIASEIQAEPLNLEVVYQNLYELYQNSGNKTSANEYAQKLSAIQLEIERSKNESLHTIIEKKMLDDRETIIYISAGLSLVILILFGVIVYFRRKNKLLLKQEKMSQQYLEEKAKEPKEHDYTRLIEMLQNNDSAFLVSFHEVFPDFTEKLKKINPKLVSTEAEFCALLKLNLSTKEIARFKNIEPKSVQTRKHRVRKKLHIPDNEDIYFWFNRI